MQNLSAWWARLVLVAGIVLSESSNGLFDQIVWSTANRPTLTLSHVALSHVAFLGQKLGILLNQ